VQEVEVKLRVPSIPAIRRKLRLLGFERTSARLFERNRLFDTPGQTLRRSGQVLRLRSKGGRWWLTWKGREGPPGRHKVREELEVEIGAGERLTPLLGRLGYFATFEYQKYRTEYRQPRSRGQAVLDETPLGDFLELEGPPRWIDRVAAQLGYSRPDYVLDSYVALYFADCERRGRRPGNMVFPKRAGQ
jgi:adenylate cyclase class 2